MKREKNQFGWNCESGILTISTNEEKPVVLRTYDTNRYPEAIRQDLYDNGCKATFNQRSSQVEPDEKLGYWDKLDQLFAGGEWEFERSRGPVVAAAWMEAACAALNVSLGVFQASYAKYDDATKAKIKAKIEADYKEEIKAIKDARVGGVDLSDFIE